MEEGESDPRTRTLDVTLRGGAPWGFSLKGGSEHRCPLTIARIEPGGKASQSGTLQVDDIILSINNFECEAHTEAIHLVKRSPDTLQLIIQRSGSDLHLRQTMKQTDYSKSPPLQDLSPPAVKSPCIYDVAPSPPPQPYEKSGHIYDTKKSPDYDVHPSPKAAAGGVTRRMKKSETAKQPRPKSWHTADGSETWEDPGFRTSPKPVAQTLPQPAPQQAPHLHSPRLDPMEKLTVIETFHKRPLPHSNTHSMINLHDFKDEAEPGHGFVKRRVSEYIYSSNQELSSSRKDKDFYFVCSDKRESLTPFNPKFRDVNLQPAETYPKVAMATQIKSAQQKAYIGRVPGTQTPPESQPHTCSSSQVVSYSTVQMPERHYASTMKLTGKYCDENTLPHQQKPEPQVSPTSGHLVYRATPRMSPSPTFSDKREPPTPPQRGDSRNRTQQMSEQRKRPSWPLHAHKMQDNSGRPSSITLEAPPVKLSPQQDQPRPSLITGEPELLYTYSGEPHPDIPTSTSSVSQGELETVGSNTFPGMNRNRDKVDYLYTAVPLYVDPGSDDPETGINSFFPSSSPQNVPEKQSSLENQPRGSPPTRDSVDRITVDSDPLVAALESYMRTAVDHEEQLHGVNPEDSSTGSESPVHHPRSVSHGDHNRPQCQTQPMSITRNEGEKRLSRTSLSSLDSHSSSGHRVKSPTSRLSSDEEEQNRKNSQLGNANQRTWKNPNDFSSKKAEIDTEKHWQDIVRLANPNWGDKYQQSDLSTNSKSEGHVRTSSQIDEKLIRGNAPGIRSPISPLMMEAVTTIEPSKPETIIETQQKEIKFLKAEGRDSGYEVDSENPFRSQQESPVPHVTDTFSSDDWMKMGNMESTGGTSILSQLQKETPYSQHYTNGEPIVKPTANQKTANESSRQKVARSEASITQTRNSRPQPVCPPKSRDDFFKDVKGPTGQVVKDERSVCGSQPQLSRPGGSDSSSRHYHSSSLDLDTKATGAQLLAQPSFPPWKPESSNDSSSVFHTRSHSYSGGGYPSYSGPSEPRFSRIDEEQGVESSESVPSSQSTNRPDRRSAGGPLNRSHGSYDGEGRSHRRGDSDPNSGPFPVRKTSVESKGKADSDYRHGYSKSDSERHRKSSATDQWHKNSDPSGAISKPHRVSDSHENIREVLGKYVETKRNLLRSDGTVFGSNQGSLSGYGSMASLDQSSRFSSTTSLYGKPGWSMDSVDHSRQSSYSSQASHAHRDSGIVSPSESSWGPPSPNTSPPGAMDHRPRNQQRVLDHHHQRAASDSTHRTERVRDTNSLGRSSLSMSDEYRPTKKVSRSNSMIHSSRVRPQSYHDPRDGFRSRDDSSKGLSRTETFSIGQGRSGAPTRRSLGPSATLPAGGFHSSNAKPYFPSHPIRAEPCFVRSPLSLEPGNADDVPPALPPKQIKEAHLKTIAKVESRLPKEDEEAGHQIPDKERERKASGPGHSVFNFPSPTHGEQHRYPSPKTSPTSATKEPSPSAQVTSRPRTRTSPPLPSNNKDISPTRPVSAGSRTKSTPDLAETTERSPSHPASTRPRTRASPPLTSTKGTSPTHQGRPRTRTSPLLPTGNEASLTHPGGPRTRISPPPAASEKSLTHPAGLATRTSPSLTTSKETSPAYQVPASPRPRAESFDLPPPPTPPAVPVIEDLEQIGELPPPPPEVLGEYPICQEEDKHVVEEQITRRRAAQIHAAVSRPESQIDHASSPSASSRTSSPNSVDSTEEGSAFTNPDIDQEGRPRSETPKREVRVSPSLDNRAEEADILTRSSTPSSLSRISPVGRGRPPLDLGLEDEAKPIEVIEIVHTPTLSPKRGERDLPGSAREHSQDPLVDWVLHSLNPQDVALRELFKFPEEPQRPGALTEEQMPHEKKGEAQTPKRSECDVKSLTHALSSSMYLQISPAKALLLTRAKSMSGPSEVVQGDSEELRKTKEELISRLARKVSDLRKEKEELLKEMSNIEDLGRQVTENVRKSCKTSNVDKYLMYVGDADRVTKLLLSLSRRLAKVNSVLDRLEGNDEEEQKPDLQKMHEDLMGKYEDAKGLKKSIDARHVQISSMLQDHLSPEEYEDFCHFVPMRSRQRITAQELDDRIALGEEQLQALRESLKGEGRPEGEGSQCGAQAS